MSDLVNLADFLDPFDLQQLHGNNVYHKGQIGFDIARFEKHFPDVTDADMVFIGCGETRGSGHSGGNASPDAIRAAFYPLHNWHTAIRLADLGNLKSGKALSDTYAALQMVVKELLDMDKTVVILGGSHDLTLPVYRAYAERNEVIEAAVVDALVDINTWSGLASDHFLMELLTGEPNFLRQYNHIGFQSYLVHPSMLEALDKLRFDCYRVGKVKENIEEMEPVLRNCQLLSFDITAIANAYAPANTLSPNGLDGEQACALMRYAGLSPSLRSVGIFGYSAERDRDQLTAKQISQMLWYFMEGRSRGSSEASLQERESFNEYHIAFAEIGTLFLQSKKTGRWWMQLPDKQFIACSQQDYLQASSNEIPERWLRAQERS